MKLPSFWQRKTLGLRNLFWALLLLLVVLIVAIIPAAVICTRPSKTASVQWRDVRAAEGDTLPDFSYCGYAASERSLPSTQDLDAKLQTQVTVDGDDTDMTRRIQKALDATADKGGGVVTLPAGNLSLSSTGLVVPAGVVLRGAGVNQTFLTMTELSDTAAITLGNATTNTTKTTAAVINRTVDIVDTFVPVGAVDVTVADASGLAAGQTVLVQRAVTEAWVQASGMGDLELDGKTQTWLQPGTLVWQPRTIAAVAGTNVTLSVPLTDRLDASYMQPQLVVYTPPASAVAADMGVQDLTVQLSPSCAGADVNNEDDPCNQPAVAFAPWATDAWAHDLHLVGFNAFVDVAYNASRISVANVTMDRDRPLQNADTVKALPADIYLYGSQVLVADCAQVGDPSARSFAVMTESLTPGPNAVLRHRTPAESKADLKKASSDSSATSSLNQMIFPHQRWAHGFLVEDTDTPTLMANRATNGSGQGWAISGGVGWNLRGYSLVQSPPLGVNWCVGCSGTVDGRSNGSDTATDKRVSPQSLYAAQLADRQ